jgi:hypothetical protein
MDILFCTTSFFITMVQTTGGSEWWVVCFCLMRLLMIPVIENDFSYTRNAHWNDDAWIIIQDMPNRSHDLRTKARHFVNDDAIKIVMMVRLIKLQNHFVFVVASKQIGRLTRTCDIEPGSLKDDYIHPSTLDNTNM